MSKEILRCEETWKEIKPGRLLIGVRPGSQRVHVFDAEVLSRMNHDEKGRSPRKKDEGGMNFYWATSETDPKGVRCLDENLRQGVFVCAVSSKTIRYRLPHHFKKQRIGF